MAELASARLGRGERTVLDRIDLRIAAGESVAVIGKSGSGKSTLLETLVGLIPPLSGDVRLFGQSLVGLANGPLRRLLRRLGVVFQSSALFRDMDVAENLAVGVRAHGRLAEPVIAELVAMKLEQVGMRGLAHRFPYELSGGQQRRVAFARAVMLDPELVVCDEPTAGLDPINASNIAALIAGLRSDLGAAVLVVTHDTELIARTADRVVVLGEGTVLTQGTVRELRTHRDPAVAEFFSGGRAAGWP